MARHPSLENGLDAVTVGRHWWLQIVEGEGDV
jgi:hypothetical protein